MLPDLIDRVKPPSAYQYYGIGIISDLLGTLSAAGQQLCKVLNINKDPFFFVAFLSCPDTTRPLSFFLLNDRFFVYLILSMVF